MPKALFVTYGGGHVNMVIPTVRELERRGGWDVSVLGLTTARLALRAAGISAFGFADLVAAGDVDVLTLGRELLAGNHAADKGVEERESIAYLGLCYADLRERLGPGEAARLYAERGRQGFLPIGPLRGLLEREAPDVVVATSSPRAERAALLAARELGIPAVLMIDLFGLEWDFLEDPDYADRVLVISEWTKRRFAERG